MAAVSSLFADACAATCAQSNCFVVGQIAQPGDEVMIYLPGDASVACVQVENIGTGTLGFQMTADGVNWVACQMYAQPTDEPVTATTTNGLWRGSVAGMSQFRVASSLDYAGSMAQVSIRVSPADLFVDTDIEHVNDPVPTDDVLRANIAITETGEHQIVAGVADRKIRVHRVKLAASEAVQVAYMSGAAFMSGFETCDVQLLDFDPVYPWYITADGAALKLSVLLADGSGAAPDVEPVTVGGSVWYSLSPEPVVLP